MKKSSITINAIFFSGISIALFLIPACEKLDNEPSVNVETQVLNKSNMLSLSETPDIIINTTTDVIDFTGDQLVADLPGPDGLISLREAIVAANQTSGEQIIHFHIPTSDTGFDGSIFTIQPTEPLPGLNDNGINIDGRSQTLFSGDTNPFGPEIVLDGNLAGETPGITISSDNNTIRDLVIHNFIYTGIQFNHDPTHTHPMNVQIAGCYIGTDETGSTAIGNGWEGIAENGSNNMIGGPEPSDGNLISGNNFQEVQIDGSGTVMQQNRIGTDRTGTVSLSNGNANGIVVGRTFGCVQVLIRDNLISGNGGTAILIEGAYSAGNTLSRNRIYSNGGLGIDLNSDGVTLNDANDSDTGPNNLINFPVLISAQTTPGKLVVKGIIDTPNPETITIEFFANPEPNPGGDPSGYGEGAMFLGTKTSNPQGKFTAVLPSVAPGTMISATATDAAGNTSEFSLNIKAKAPGL